MKLPVYALLCIIGHVSRLIVSPASERGIERSHATTTDAKQVPAASLRRLDETAVPAFYYYYYNTSDPAILGKTRRKAALGNPLKGLLSSPRWLGGDTPEFTVSSSLEFYYIAWDEIVKGARQFDWSVLDETLANAASRSNHVIWRIYCHYPGQSLRVPKYLIDAGIKLVDTQDAGKSPQYDDPLLLEAFEQFIAAFGKRYDGHKSLAFIQLGLLGYWVSFRVSASRRMHDAVRLTFGCCVHTIVVSKGRMAHVSRQ
jgi:hypothetical protein